MVKKDALNDVVVFRQRAAGAGTRGMDLLSDAWRFPIRSQGLPLNLLSHAMRSRHRAKRRPRSHN